ncbi:aromatic-L-amino-acid decarboxylase-like isoform X1 [Dermacentor andersoni]|uniref:aromatic-L-amino-acid decarboxylase-like isoform X1 n=1 Tax=Dermacentor andersoni TaxID=34620 RepID=UPI002415CC94|nr:aromatic-L-amino-acid decarboxylase-like isoform X1 [Dermacentor andersoni]
MDDEQFREAGHQLLEFALSYFNGLRNRPVLPDVAPGYLAALVPSEAPQEPEKWEDIFKDIERVILPGMTHWHSPHFHAYFPTGQSPPSLLADMLSSTFAIVGFTWIASPANTELEMMVMDWLGKAIDLPSDFLFSTPGINGGGVIQSTASECTLTAVLAAKTKVTTLLLHQNPSLKPSQVWDKLVVYASCQAHSSVERAALLASVRFHVLNTDDQLAVRGPTLRAVIQEDRRLGFIPMVMVATLGTTNSCAFDNLEEIGVVCDEESLWLHVDAAYAGSSFICPEYRHYMKGIEHVSSFSMNPHKWLLVNVDCSAMWFRKRTDIEEAFKVNPLYLKHDNEGGKVPDYRHWTIPLGRRFRSLKLWFVFRCYGINGLQAHIRRQIDLAREFEKLVNEHEHFEVVVPVTMALVCFRYKGSNADNEDLLHILHKRRTIYLTPTKLRGVFVLRFAICSRLTENEDVHYAWHEVCAALQTLEQQQRGMSKHEEVKFSTPYGYVKRMPLQGEADQNRGANRACANRLLEKYNQIKDWLFRN